MPKPKTRNLGRTIGMLAHTEIASSDPEVTRTFLKEAFGWSFEAHNGPAGEFIEFQTQGGARGSIRKTQANETPVSINYILVDDLEAMASKVKQVGGEIVLPRTDVPHMGSFFWFKVPGGPVLACWQDAPDRREE
jgi:uncharacterized protein